MEADHVVFFACSQRASASSGVTWCWRGGARTGRSHHLCGPHVASTSAAEHLARWSRAMACGRTVVACPRAGGQGCGWRAGERLVRLCLLTECAVEQ